MNDKEIIRQAMCRILDRPVNSLSDDVALETVGDSLDLIELILELQEELDVSFTQDDFSGKDTVGDLITLFADCVADRQRATESEA